MPIVRIRRSRFDNNGVNNWRRALTLHKDNNSTFSILFPATTQTNTKVIEKVFGKPQAQSFPILPENEASDEAANYSPRSRNISEIQDVISRCLANREGIFSTRKLVYRTFGWGLAAISAVPFFPKDSPDSDSSYCSLIGLQACTFLYNWNILLSNAFFISSTLIARILTTRANDITQKIDDLTANYHDLESYLRQCCNLKLIDTQNQNHYYLKPDLQKANYIIANSWRIFCENNSISIEEFRRLNKYRISEASSNMMRALISYLIMFKSTNKRAHPFTDDFVLQLSILFAASLEERYMQIGRLKRYISFRKKWHLSFYDMPTFQDFAGLISKIHGKIYPSQPDLDQEHKNDEFIANFSGVSQLSRLFTSFQTFHQNKPLLKNIGVAISERTGSKCHWLYTSALGSLSALLGGLPWFGQIYDKPEVYSFAFYIIMPIALLLVGLIEKILLNIEKSEEKFKAAYYDFEKNLVKLVDNNIINIADFNGEVLTERNVTGENNFTKCMTLINRILKAIDINKFSKKEQALITLELFNAFANFVTTNKDLINPDQTLVEIEQYLETKYSSWKLASLYRATPARKHLCGKIDVSELSSIIFSYNKMQTNQADLMV